MKELVEIGWREVEGNPPDDPDKGWYYKDILEADDRDADRAGYLDLRRHRWGPGAWQLLHARVLMHLHGARHQRAQWLQHHCRPAGQLNQQLSPTNSTRALCSAAQHT